MGLKQEFLGEKSLAYAMEQARLHDLIDISGFKINVSMRKKPSVLCFAFSANPLSLLYL